MIVAYIFFIWFAPIVALVKRKTHSILSCIKEIVMDVEVVSCTSVMALLHDPFATAPPKAAHDMYTRTLRRGALYVFSTVQRSSELTYLSFTSQRKHKARGDVRLRRGKQTGGARSRLRRSTIARNETAGRGTSLFAKRSHVVDPLRFSIPHAAQNAGESLAARGHHGSHLDCWTAGKCDSCAIHGSA